MVEASGDRERDEPKLDHGRARRPRRPKLTLAPNLSRETLASIIPPAPPNGVNGITPAAMNPSSSPPVSAAFMETVPSAEHRKFKLRFRDVR